MSLTPLGVTVLGLLFERSMHPYEMCQLAAVRRGHVVKIRPGSLYHTVGRLDEEGLVRAVGTGRSGNRPERTVYEITDPGREALVRQVGNLLATPVREYPQFALALAEAHNVDLGTVVRLLRERLTHLEREIEELEVESERARSAQTPRIFVLGNDYLNTLAHAEREWLRALLADIDSGELPWLTTELLESTTFSRRLGPGSVKD